MSNLYTLPTWALVAFCLWAMLSFVAGSFLYFYLAPQAVFRGIGPKLLELGNLALLLLFLGLPYEAMHALSTGIFQTQPYFFLRTGLSCAAGALALYWAHRRAGSLYILTAAVLALPFFDEAMPWTLMAAILVLDIRLARLLPTAFRQYHSGLTTDVIQEAVDALPEGIFLCRENGEPVLVNRAMETMMRTLLSTTIGNGNILWHLLGQGHLRTASMERVGQNLLFRTAGRQVLLISREPFSTPGGDGWQMTASDVTGLDRMNRDLAERNKALARRNEDMKELLSHVVDLEARDTLRDIRYKVHDMMGQRISYLQRILNNKDYKNYGRIGDLLSHLLTDMEQEINVKPNMVLSELVSAYKGLGITLCCQGTLPKGAVGALFVDIIREAASNAIIHGKASEISITFSEDTSYHLTITDNGLGTKGSLHEGGGLSSIRSKVEKWGGHVGYSGREHFTLEVEVPGEGG